ncbi:hypothetical protein SCA6_012024 [Theobroma cacao]
MDYNSNHQLDYSMAVAGIGCDRWDWYHCDSGPWARSSSPGSRDLHSHDTGLRTTVYGRRQNQIKSKQRIIGNWKAQSKTVYGKSTGLKHFFNLNLSNLNRSKLRCHLSFSFQVAAAIETDT